MVVRLDLSQQFYMGFGATEKEVSMKRREDSMGSCCMPTSACSTVNIGAGGVI